MSGFEIVSADAHVLEPTDIWETWLPKQYRDKAPKLVKDVDGGDAWLFAGATDPDPIGLVSTPGMAWDDFRWTGITYEQARAGCYNGSERIKDMDIDGVDAEILFPPQRTIGHFLGDEDGEVVGCRGSQGRAGRVRRQGGQGQRQGGRRPGQRVLRGAEHDRPADLHWRVRALPRVACVDDRDGRRLDPALPGADRRPLLAQ